MASIPNIMSDRQLTRDQQKLADAVSENSKESSTAQGVANQAARLKDNVQFAGSGVNLASKIFRGGKTLFNIGRGGVTAPLTIADYVVEGTSEDGKGLYEKIGDRLGSYASEKLYGDTSQPPMSEQEIQAIKEGKNPLKPIQGSQPAPMYNPMEMGRGSPVGGNVVDFEPIAQKSEQELASAAKENLGSRFEGSALMPSGQTKGYLADGTSKIMTPDEISAFKEVQDSGVFSGVPMGEFQAVPDTEGSVRLPAGQSVPMSQEQYIERYSQLQDAARSGMSEGGGKALENLEKSYFNQERFQRAPQPSSAPEVGGMSDKGAKMLADFEKFKRSGREMTPEMINKAEALALSVGRTFDPETGYSKEFSPEIMEEFNRRVQEGVIDPTGMQVSAPKQPSKSSFYEQESARMQQEIKNKSDFNQGQIRVRGEMVPATEENRRIRDYEKMFKEQGRGEGLSGRELNAYAEQGFKELGEEELRNSERQEDRETKKIMDDLNISNARASLLAKKAKMLEVPKISASQANSIQKLLANNGVSFDPETGALTTEVEKFMRPDGTVNLSPNSPVYELLKGVEGGEAFLATPPSVQSLASDAEVGQMVAAEDGRVYKYSGDGEFEHIL